VGGSGGCVDAAVQQIPKNCRMPSAQRGRSVLTARDARVTAPRAGRLLVSSQQSHLGRLGCQSVQLSGVAMSKSYLTTRGAAMAIAVAAAAAPAAATEQTTYQFTPSADTTLYADIAGLDRHWDDVSDGQGESLWLSTTGGGVLRRSLLRFDLQSIPAGQRVVSATLSLYELRAQDAHAVTVHRVLAPWGEGSSNGGASGVGAPATPGDATWRWRDYGVAEWSQRGGDFATTVSAVTAVGLPGETYTWGSTSVLVVDVQSWLDTPSSNHGWILIGEELDRKNAKRFGSSESGLANLRPLLVVEVAPVPEASTLAMLCAGLALLPLLRRRSQRA
jgi:hypothetical protein